MAMSWLFRRIEQGKGKGMYSFSRSIRGATNKRCLVKQTQGLSVCSRAENIQAGYACAPKAGPILTRRIKCNGPAPMFPSVSRYGVTLAASKVWKCE